MTISHPTLLSTCHPDQDFEHKCMHTIGQCFHLICSKCCHGTGIVKSLPIRNVRIECRVNCGIWFNDEPKFMIRQLEKCLQTRFKLWCYGEPFERFFPLNSLIIWNNFRRLILSKDEWGTAGANVLPSKTVSAEKKERKMIISNRYYYLWLRKDPVKPISGRERRTTTTRIRTATTEASRKRWISRLSLVHSIRCLQP